MPGSSPLLQPQSPIVQAGNPPRTRNFPSSPAVLPTPYSPAMAPTPNPGAYRMQPILGRSGMTPSSPPSVPVEFLGLGDKTLAALVRPSESPALSAMPALAPRVQGQGMSPAEELDELLNMLDQNPGHPAP